VLSPQEALHQKFTAIFGQWPAEQLKDSEQQGGCTTQDWGWESWFLYAPEAWSYTSTQSSS